MKELHYRDSTCRPKVDPYLANWSNEYYLYQIVIINERTLGYGQ